jgi:twitching motility protein PilU
MEINQLLQEMAERKASDMFFTAGARICLKINGVVRPVAMPELTVTDVMQYAYALMNDAQKERYEATREMNFGYSLYGLGRFRVNVFRQRGSVAMVIRRLASDIPSVEELHLPGIIERLAMQRRGLVLVVGATGSGKSTTMASMIDYRSHNTAGHILTVEDPIEYVFKHRKSIVNQREVGADTDSYDAALMNALRESPDMIMIGEIRDSATMSHAINYANTGHVCLSTLHAINSHQALTRIVNFYPLENRATVLFDLAACLVGIVAQRLVRTVHGDRMPAMEIFLADYHMRQLIRENRIDEISDMMEKSTAEEMQSFDQAVVKLYRDGLIDFDEAYANADSPRQLHLMIHGSGAAAPPPTAKTDTGDELGRGRPPVPEIEVHGDRRRST